MPFIMKIFLYNVLLEAELGDIRNYPPCLDHLFRNRLIMNRAIKAYPKSCFELLELVGYLFDALD